MVIDYNEDDYKPTVISAHDLKLEVRRPSQSTDKRLITKKLNNDKVPSGEELEILNLKEQGVLHSIELVVDNPYVAIRLEIDDFVNNPDGGSETVAEMLLNNRTTRVDGQLWVKTIGNDGSYTIMYTPNTPEPYENRLFLSISNRIRPSRDVYGMSLRYQSRGGIPTPIKTDFMGGGTFTHTGLKEVALSLMAKAITKPIGSSTYAVSDVYNETIYTENVDIGTGHPYQGIAGKPTFTEDSIASSSNYVEVFDVGTAGTDSGAIPNPALSSTGNFPGTPSTPSAQNIVVYNSSGRDATDATSENIDTISVGDRLYLRNKGVVYFPGKVEAIHRYNRAADAGVDGWYSSTAGADYDNATGAYAFQVNPGLRQTPSAFSFTDSNDTLSMGTVISQSDTDPQIFLKRAVIKRQRLVSKEL